MRSRRCCLLTNILIGGGGNLLLLLLLQLPVPGVMGNGHGVLCSTQFNFWYVTTPDSFKTIPNLTEGMGPCEVQAYSDTVYESYVQLGKGTDGYAGYPNAGTGMNAACTEYNATTLGPDGGLPAGGCAYSYAAFTSSTCRIKTNTTHELQWCYNDLETTLRLGVTTVPTHFVTNGDPFSPYNNSVCDEEVKYEQSFDPTAYGSAENVQTYLHPRFRLYASTRLNICDRTLNDHHECVADHASSSRAEYPTTTTTTTGAIVFAVVGVMVFGLL